MELYDTVRCFAEVPGAGLLGNGESQTKDFGCRCKRFTIDHAGRLIHHCPVYDSGEPFAQSASYQDTIVPIHRDGRLSDEDEAGRYRVYCCRFTVGTLQWGKPWEELTEAQREYAVTVKS